MEENKNKETEQAAQQEAKDAQNDQKVDKTQDAANDTKAQDAAAEEQPEKDPLAEAQQQIADLKNKYLRCAAEFDNYKKRTLKEKAELILNGSERTVTAVLPVLDDFERALADKSDDVEAIRKGVEMIYNKFLKALEGIGVKKIDTTDKDFDTDMHEAVAMVPGQPDEKKGKVIDCLQAGYTLNDKVIRHAKVAVAQ